MLMGRGKNIVEKYLKFDGDDDKVDLGAILVNELTGSITVAAWINPITCGENNYGRVIDNGD